MPEFLKFLTSLDMAQLTSSGMVIAYLIYSNIRLQKKLDELVSSTIETMRKDIDQYNQSITTLSTLLDYLRGRP